MTPFWSQKILSLIRYHSKSCMHSVMFPLNSSSIFKKKYSSPFLDALPFNAIKNHPSIFFTRFFLSISQEPLVPISSSHWGGQVSSPPQKHIETNILTHTYEQFKLTWMFYCLWEEIGVHNEILCMHRENMHTIQKGPRPGSNPATFSLRDNSSNHCALHLIIMFQNFFFCFIDDNGLLYIDNIYSR